MDISVDKDEQHPDQSDLDKRRLARLLLLAGVLLFVLWLGLKSWRIFQAARSLQQRPAEAAALLEKGPMEVDPEAAEALVLGIREDVVVLRQETTPFMWLAPAFQWLPRVGPLAAEARPLLEMADAGTAAAVYGMRGLKPALPMLQDGADNGQQLIPALLPILEEAGPDLAAAAAELDRVVEARAEIENVEALPWTVQQLLTELDGKLYLIDELRFLQVLPAFLGSDGPRSYLLMAQNEDELRATGGFLSGAGVLTVDNGQIMSLEFMDGNMVDAWHPTAWTFTKPYGPAPEPLRQLMGSHLLLYRDTNFWPDFPTSAEQSMALYSYGQDAPPLDGAIAVNQHFLSMLLSVTGPVYVPFVEQNVGADNVVAAMREAWRGDEQSETEDWIMERKDFLGPLAASLQTHLLDNFAGLDLLYLAETMHRALSQKHLQFYVRDPEVATMLDQLDWDGRLEAQPASDVLLAVDTNVGFNKVNPLIESALSYEITLNETGTGLSEAVLTYRHTDPEPFTCSQGLSYGGNFTYTDLMHNCYWNYQRLYTPSGSQLLEGSDHPVSEDLFAFSEGWPGGVVTVDDEPGGLKTFANFFVLAPGEQLKSFYRYQLPDVVVTEEDVQVYRLDVLRQAGIQPRSVSVTVHLPAGTELVSAYPAPSRSEAGTVVFESLLETNKSFTVTYR